VPHPALSNTGFTGNFHPVFRKQGEQQSFGRGIRIRQRAHALEKALRLPCAPHAG
jgi:hypothetical protein